MFLIITFLFYFLASVIHFIDIRYPDYPGYFTEEKRSIYQELGLFGGIIADFISGNAM